MIRIRSFIRLAALAASLSFTSAASAAQADYFLALDGIDGEIPVADFEIGLAGAEPQAALLLPAIQKVREAAARQQLREAACTGAHIREATMKVRKAGTPQASPTIVLEDVLVSSTVVRGGDGQPMESISFNYTKITFLDAETGEATTYDCASGRCACEP